MSLTEDVRAYAELVTTSFDNAMSTVETVHQGVADMVLGVMQEAGLPSDAASGISDRHRRTLRTVYGAICSANHELGDLIVVQMEQLGTFADRIGLPLPDSPRDEVEGAVTRLTGRRGRG
jgi:hypothetical protein